MASTPSTAQQAEQGVVFPTGSDGRASTMAVNQAVFVDAVAASDPVVADVLKAEDAWRDHYAEHIRTLIEVGMRSSDNALAISRDGLASLRGRMLFRRGDDESSIGDAMATYGDASIATATVQGRGGRSKGGFAVPYRGQTLLGPALRNQLADWVERGIAEPSFAEALTLVSDNPDWLDLSDQSVAVLGAGSQMGPLLQLCEWGADVWALDLPHPPVWARVIDTARSGSGRMRVPVPAGHRLAGTMVDEADDVALAEVAGGNVISDTPELLAWLSTVEGPLTVGNYVYADSGIHVRASVAIDAVMTGLTARADPLMLAFLATPTDVFSVPGEVVADAQRRYDDTSLPATLLGRPMNIVSGRRVFERHYATSAYHDHDRAYGIADNLVVRQGPNYALAKRMQRWRASVARDEGTAASLNIAPPTRTHSVVKNRAFALAYAGMGRFGLEVFEPDTSNALMAGMLVHDLRNPCSSARPDVALDHPLDLFVDGANPGGMWRSPYEPNSIMAAAAVAGLFEGRA